MHLSARRVPPAVVWPCATLLCLAATAGAEERLSADDVRRVIAQASGEAARVGLRAYLAVTDRDGHLLGLHRMDGAPFSSTIPGRRGRGLEGRTLQAELVAQAKAATAAFLSSGGHAFSTRTAGFIVQSNFPPGVRDQPGGPLFGVQFSSLACTDVKQPNGVLGLSADPGGLPLYKAGELVGGVGVEGDGVYGVDLDPSDFDQPPEEIAALAGARGFEPPELIRADRILADGVRLPYINVEAAGGAAGAAPGLDLVPARGGQPSSLVPGTIAGVPVRVDPRFPTRAGVALSAADVARVLEQAVTQGARTRGAIRQPLGSHARVSFAVVDVDGRVLGFAQNVDAPNFGIDVAVQKARTAAFFSGPGAGDDLRRAGLAIYLSNEVPLDGSVAYTTRAVGFLAQPFFPPGIRGTDPGPFSVPIAEWSPFNTGLQLDLVRDALDSALTGLVPPRCSAAIPRLPNGITIFPGGVPLYKEGRFAGAIGISGDGVDQDDLIAAAGAAGFEAPPERRCDRRSVRGVRLPYVKFPRHPEL
jgi:uncharacterized protein GlcG (DUF336 family)